MPAVDRRRLYRLLAWLAVLGSVDATLALLFGWRPVPIGQWVLALATAWVAYDLGSKHG